MSIPWEHVEGSTNHHDIRLYALSTCGWCRKTKELLNELGIEYYLVYVDKLDSEEKDEAIESMKPWNDSVTFPTIVIDNAKSIVGYKADKLKKEIV